MLSLVSFKKQQKTTLKERFSVFDKPKALLESYEEDFGIINIYTVYYYKNKEKALNTLLKFCQDIPYQNSAETPQEYKKALTCKQLIKSNKDFKKSTLCLHFSPEKQLLFELCSNFSKVFIVSDNIPDFLDEIWHECGTVPSFCSFPIAADYTLTGHENAVLSKLPPPFDSICPNDFAPTLFAGLLYKENGIFIS